MYILTNGKNYVMENPMKSGKYLSTTSPIQAKEFTYKQARSLITRSRNKNAWIKSFYIVNNETGEMETDVAQFSNEGIFCDDKSFEFDDSILETIKKEVDSIIGLAAWDINQLNTYKSMLIQGQQFYDSAISDIRHARMDKHPPAHVMTKIDKLSNDLQEKRRDIKQTILYVDVLLDATKQQWTLGKIKAELSKAKYVPYKGRTKYFSIVEDMLKDY